MQLLFQTRCPSFIIFFYVCTCILFSGCRQKSHGAPAGYDFHKHQRRELGKVLNEISGLAFNEDSNTLLAISDSKRKIYQINLKTQKLNDYAEKFAEQADFEDLVKIDNTIFVLVSNGTILAVPPNAKDSSGKVAYPFWSKEKNDFEAMYHDPAANALIILCKSCAHEKGLGTRTAYRFDLSGRKFDSSIFYTVNSDSVKAAVKNTDASFRPSAAALHPIEKRLYILASSGQLMAITDTRGKVIEAYNLNPDRNPQAEGIAFSPNGTMFISNEGKYGKATLQVFPYKARRKPTKTTE